MSIRVCKQPTKSGKPCGFPPMKDSDYCYQHDPNGADARRKSNAVGGRNRATKERIYAALPEDLKDTANVLYRTLGALERGDMEPARATAIATVARAIVAVFETGDAERRISEIEKLLTERDAA